MDSPPAHATGREPAPPRLRVGRTAEHELSTGHRVVPGRNAELEVAATLADAVLRRLLSTCRMGSAERSNGQASSYSIFSNRFTLMRSGAPPGTRTPNPLIKSVKFTHSGTYYLGFYLLWFRRRGIKGTHRTRVNGQFNGQDPPPPSRACLSRLKHGGP